MEPLTSLTAGAIAQLAFGEFVKSGAGELAKQSLAGTVEMAKQLRNKVLDKLRGNSQAVKALEGFKQDRSMTTLENLAEQLDIEMKKDDLFATELKHVAQQIVNHQNRITSVLKQQNINNGRDQNIINQPQGDIKIGGS